MPYVWWNRRAEDPAIAQIVLSREPVMNAFNTEMAEQLIAVCRDIGNRADVRVVGVVSSNSKFFSTGADFKERNNMTDEQWKKQHKLFEEMFYSLNVLFSRGSPHADHRRDRRLLPCGRDGAGAELRSVGGLRRGHIRSSRGDMGDHAWRRRNAVVGEKNWRSPS